MNLPDAKAILKHKGDHSYFEVRKARKVLKKHGVKKFKEGWIKKPPDETRPGFHERGRK